MNEWPFERIGPIDMKHTVNKEAIYWMDMWQFDSNLKKLCDLVGHEWVGYDGWLSNKRCLVCGTSILHNIKAQTSIDGGSLWVEEG